MLLLAQRFACLVLLLMIAGFLPGCGGGRAPTVPRPPTITPVSAVVSAARGDTLTTRDSRGIEYTLEIPAGALTADGTVSLGTSAVDFGGFSDVVQSTVPLSIASDVAFQDSIRLRVTLAATNPVAVSSVDGQFRYEQLQMAGTSPEVAILPPTTAASGLRTAAGGLITTWVGDVADNAYELKTRNTVDLGDATRPCVIVLHGLRQRAADVDELTTRIAASFPTMTFTYPTYEKTARQSASTLKAQLAALGPIRSPLIFVGYSMGGLVARYFANLDDTERWTRAVLYVATPNNGVGTSEALNGWITALMHSGLLVPPAWRPSLGSLLQGSSELDILNQTGRSLDADYFFFVGNCSCGDLAGLSETPNDGLVANASTDLSRYSPHESARLHAATAFPLSHSDCLPGLPRDQMDMCHDKAGLGDAIVATLNRVATVAPPPPPEMVLVPAGSFMMGGTVFADEQPVHSVYLDAYYIDKFEVTNAEFKAFIDGGGYSTQAFWSPAGWSQRTSSGWTQPAYWGDDAYRSGPNWPGFPVIGVSWYEAEAYANFVGKRLPTEAEWEKAARGTDQRTYPWGNSIDGSRANYWGSGDPYESGSAQLTPVGFYDGRLHPSPPFQTTNSPSPYGCYDMAGNVWEWVADWYSSTYYSVSPPSNPPGPLTGSYRVLRGGSWGDGASYLRSAFRNYRVPIIRSLSRGFRCARTLP